LSALATAYFVSGEPTNADATKGLKRTTNVAWANKYINAAEIACIVPIPESVLDDADYDIWTEVRPKIEEAMGVTFDQAVLYGTNAPTDWPDDLVTGATSAGNVVTIGSGTDLYQEIMG